ncbi:hypothetical protein IW262DRAFT_281760 [Armillaria fumosa]|nr:hypothetical protein IW262DRAFT_281760 [Armillaria fumosa]
MCNACIAADSYADVLDHFYVFLLASLMARWELLKDEEDVDRLLSYAEKAVTLNLSNDGAQYFLGITLCISYDHHHTLALLDRAILAMQSAVSYSMPDVRMEALTQLATAYYRRLLHVMDPSDASTCIKYIDQAMECGKISSNCHMMLINCLRDERALLICETLLADDSLSSYERCMARLELGTTLLAQWRNCTIAHTQSCYVIHANWKNASRRSNVLSSALPQNILSVTVTGRTSFLATPSPFS